MVFLICSTNTKRHWLQTWNFVALFLLVVIVMKGFWGEYTMTLAVNGKLYDLDENDVDKTYYLMSQRDLNFYQLLDELGKTYD